MARNSRLPYTFMQSAPTNPANKYKTSVDVDGVSRINLANPRHRLISNIIHGAGLTDSDIRKLIGTIPSRQRFVAENTDNYTAAATMGMKDNGDPIVNMALARALAGEEYANMQSNYNLKTSGLYTARNDLGGLLGKLDVTSLNELSSLQQKRKNLQNIPGAYKGYSPDNIGPISDTIGQLLTKQKAREKFAPVDYPTGFATPQNEADEKIKRYFKLYTDFNKKFDTQAVTNGYDTMKKVVGSIEGRSSLMDSLDKFEKEYAKERSKGAVAKFGKVFDVFTPTTMHDLAEASIAASKIKPEKESTELSHNDLMYMAEYGTEPARLSAKKSLFMRDVKSHGYSEGYLANVGFQLKSLKSEKAFDAYDAAYKDADVTGTGHGSPDFSDEQMKQFTDLNVESKVPEAPKRMSMAKAMTQGFLYTTTQGKLRGVAHMAQMMLETPELLPAGFPMAAGGITGLMAYAEYQKLNSQARYMNQFAPGANTFNIASTRFGLGVSGGEILQAAQVNSLTGRQSFASTNSLLQAAVASGQSSTDIAKITNALIAQGASTQDIGRLNLLFGGGTGNMTGAGATAIASGMIQFNPSSSTISGTVAAAGKQKGLQSIIANLASGGLNERNMSLIALAGGDFSSNLNKVAAGDVTPLLQGGKNLFSNFKGNDLGGLMAARSLDISSGEYRAFQDIDPGDFAAEIAKANDPKFSHRDLVRKAFIQSYGTINSDNQKLGGFAGVGRELKNILFRGPFGPTGTDADVISQTMETLRNQNIDITKEDALAVSRMMGGGFSRDLEAKASAALNRTTININKNGSIDATSDDPFMSVPQMYQNSTTPNARDLKKGDW